MSDLLGFVAVDRLTAWWWPVPPLVDVTEQLVPADKDVPGVALVPDDRLELTRAVYKLKATVQNICWHPTFQVCKDNVRIKHYAKRKLTSANWREFRVESCGKTVPPCRSHKKMAFVTNIFNPTAHVKVV